MRRFAPCLVALALASGCAQLGAPPATVESRVRRTDAPRAIVRVSDGARVDLATLVADLRTVPVTYCGERHDRVEDHRMQNLLLRELSSYDGSTALGMEMFQRPFQDALDLWSAGRLDEETLRRETEWDTRWGFDFALYRPMLELARSRGLRVLALNAPKELSRAVGRGGLASLDEATRAELPEMDLEVAEHRAMVMEALGGHGAMTPEQLQHIYEAQVLWDETMAETVARVMTAGGGPGHMVVLAGAFHVQAGLGIPDRATRRGAGPYRVVLVADDEDAVEALLGTTPRPADYLGVPRAPPRAAKPVPPSKTTRRGLGRPRPRASLPHPAPGRPSRCRPRRRRAAGWGAR
ncbi:MAG: ChaN family lipoprotein, partial [Myxococcota bacterium]